MIKILIRPIYDGKIISIKSMPCYLIVTEMQSFGSSEKPFPIKYAVSKSGDYIGTTRDAYRLVNKYGIFVFEKISENSCVCSIGYNLHKRKWYGWSHRAIYGFKEKKKAVRFAESVS